MFNKIHHYIVENAASILRSPTHLLPVFMQNTIVREGLNLLFKDALKDGDFEFLQNKWLKIEIRDLGVLWYISCRQKQLIVAEHGVEADACFSGNLNDLVLIAGRKEDSDTLFFQRRLSIEGDTELGLEVKNLLDGIDLEALSPVVRFGLEQLADFVSRGLARETYRHQGKQVF
jgi:predicted lipid carrier protein YhbT